jgi:hypothetical protein
LKNPTCNPPCWEGITPGKTKSEEAYNILTKIPYVKVEVYNFEAFNGKQTEWDIGNGSGGGVAKIDIKTDIVSEISIWIKKDTVQLGELINIYGMPSHIIVGFCSGDSYPGICEAFLLYDSRGLALGIGRPGKLKDQKIFVRISADNKIFELYFYTPNSPFNTPGGRKGYGYKWEGYGDYYQP